ncbi:MAG: NADH-quinone oxidoreductase subunit NuoH [Candidatus Promineifilaceae bacterium]
MEVWSETLTGWFTAIGIPEGIAVTLALGIGAVVLPIAALTLVIFLVWVTRKMIGRFQDRLGPNRLGPWGLFQTVADALKLMTKEDVVPTNADKIFFWLAPIFSVLGVLMTLAVVTWAPGFIGADLNVGVLYIVALGSIGIMGALMAGWSSSNKYAVIASFRVVAQLLSYEIPMVLAMLAPVLLVRSMRLTAIVEGQALHLGSFNIGLGWFVFIMPASFLIFLIAALAESEQTPFDLLEAESELISGFNIEYSGMKFAMFYLAQFLSSFFLGAVAVMLFLGGWQGPLVDQLPFLGFIYFFGKAMLFFLFVQWIKGTFPRIRIDQMMGFAWKVLIPAVLVLILWQMVALKLPVATWLQVVLVLLGNLATLAVIIRIISRHFANEQITTKRQFEPKSLIGTVQPVTSSSGD